MNPASHTKFLTGPAAFEQALTSRFGAFGRVASTFLLRSEKHSLFIRRHHTRLVCRHGSKQEFLTPHCPQNKNLAKRAIRTLKEQPMSRHRLGAQQHAMRIVADWSQYYTHLCPPQALGIKSSAEAYALAT